MDPEYLHHLKAAGLVMEDGSIYPELKLNLDPQRAAPAASADPAAPAAPAAAPSHVFLQPSKTKTKIVYADSSDEEGDLTDKIAHDAGIVRKLKVAKEDQEMEPAKPTAKKEMRKRTVYMSLNYAWHKVLTRLLAVTSMDLYKYTLLTEPCLICARGAEGILRHLTIQSVAKIRQLSNEAVAVVSSVFLQWPSSDFNPTTPPTPPTTDQHNLYESKDVFKQPHGRYKNRNVNEQPMQCK